MLAAMTENRSSLSDVLRHWQDAILEASQRRSCLRVRGMGSKDHVGYSGGGEILDTCAWQGIESYEPSELVLTARAGTPLHEVEAVLASRGQYLAFEPPRGLPGTEGTLGGVVASGLSGPSRVSKGAVRDHVLGVRMFNGRGEHLRFGGTVMKNVAGFDLSRLMTGSMGTLGVMTEVTLKVLPRPVATQTLRFNMSQAHAIDTVNRWAGQPLPLDASCWWHGTLWLRLQGARAAVEAATVRLAHEALGEPLTDADEALCFWSSVRDQQHAFFARGDKPLWRVSLPATHPPLLLPGHTLEDGDELVEWWGGQRWLYADAAPEVVCSAAVAAGGHASLWRSPEAYSTGRMTQAAVVAAALASPVMHQWHRQIQRAFDPSGVFNTGRLWPAATP
jgi:glycolate oxidase FAD binding subunit